jgi:hypothetical protein
MTKINKPLIAIFYIAPAVVLAFKSGQEAIHRLIIIWALLAVGLCLLARAAVDRRVTFINPQGKLFNSPRKKGVESGLRVAVAGVALLLAVYVALPLGQDTYKWSTRAKAPITVTAKVVDDHAVFGTWFLYQRLSLFDDPGPTRQDVYLLYSLEPVRAGQLYRITFLEKSRIVLAIDALRK